jgi:hypothetical protein
VIKSWGVAIGLVILLFLGAFRVEAAFPVISTNAPAAGRYQPHLAYNQDRDEFLVVWKDKRGDPTYKWDEIDYGLTTDGDIYGQVVKTDGTRVGSEIAIATLRGRDEQHPFVVYNPQNKEYVVLVQRLDDKAYTASNWLDYCYNITAYRVSANGQVIEGEFSVSEAADCQWDPQALYNPTNNTILVAYHDHRGRDTYAWKAIFAQVVGYSSTGGLEKKGGEFYVTREIGVTPTQEAREFQQYPALAWNMEKKQIAVIWGDDRLYNNGGGHHHSFDIFGQLLEADYSFNKENYQIFAADYNQHYPTMSYNPAARQYYLTWISDTYDTGNEINIGIPYLIRMTAEGAAVGQPQSLEAEGRTSSPVDVGCLGTGSCLAVWTRRTTSQWNGEIFGRRIDQSGNRSEIIKINDNSPLYPDQARVGMNNQQFVVTYAVNDQGNNLGQIYLQPLEEGGTTKPTPTGWAPPTPVTPTPPASTTSPFNWGVGQCHTDYGMENSQVTWTYPAEEENYWSILEPQPYTYNWELLDKVIEEHRKLGKKIWLQVLTSDPCLTGPDKKE